MTRSVLAEGAVGATPKVRGGAGALVFAALCTLLVAAALFAADQHYRDGLLRDTDDYMRLVQVRDFLGGAGWYDLTQERLDPPEGVAMHWSRLHDLPIAGLTALLEVHFERDRALWIAAGIVPLVFLFFFFCASLPYARIPAVRLDAPALLVMTACCLMALAQFMPGRVDHHGVQLGLTGLITALICLSLLGERGWPPAALAGGLAAASLWIGLETLPYVVMLQVFLAVAFVTGRSGAVAIGFTFATVTLAGALLVRGLAVPPGHSWQVQCDVISPPYLSGLTLLAFGWLLVSLLQARLATPAMRAGVVALVGAGIATLAYVAIPECRAGPYSHVDPAIVPIWLDHVSEAQPLLRELAERASPGRFIALGLPVGGLLIAAVYLLAGTSPERRLLLLCATLLLAGSLAVSFSQVRAMPYAQLFSVVPWAMLLGDLMRRPVRGLGRRLGRLGLAVLLVPGAAIALPGLIGYLAVGAEAEERGQSALRLCPVQPVASELAALGGGTPLLIAAHVDLGPEILYRTDHKVLAAPYHRNGRGILDGHHIVQGGDPEVARQTIAERGVDLLLLCDSWLAQPEETRGERGEPRSWAEGLLTGPVPPWLSEVTLPEGLLRAFRVDRAVLGQGG